MLEPIWKIESNMYWWTHKNGSKQYHYCKLSKCGYGQLTCPHGVKICRRCRLHRLGVISDYVRKLYV